MFEWTPDPELRNWYTAIPSGSEQDLAELLHVIGKDIAPCETRWTWDYSKLVSPDCYETHTGHGLKTAKLAMRAAERWYRKRGAHVAAP